MSDGITVQKLRRYKNKSQRLARMVMILAGLVFFAGGFYSVAIYALRYIAKTEMIASVSWDITISGPAWSFQREYLTYTDTACVVIPIAGEGERVSKGLEIARLNFEGGSSLNEPTNRRVYSQVAGIVSFNPDGLELINEKKDYGELTISNLESKIGKEDPAHKDNSDISSMIQEKLKNEGLMADDSDETRDREKDIFWWLGSKNGEKAEPKAAAADTVVVKVRDNLSDCYVYMRLPESKEAPFAQSDIIHINLDGFGDGKGSVVRCEKTPEGWGLLFKLDQGLEVLRYSRRHYLRLMIDTEEKIAVPPGTVVMKNGDLGVYKSEKGRTRWKPVNVVGERDGLQIIESVEPGAVSKGDLVATRPWLIWDGMRLRD